MTRRSKGARRRDRRLLSLAAGGLVIAAIALVIVLAVYGSMGGGGDKGSAPQAVETPSEDRGGEPFQGGARIYLPVESVDLGQVPFNTEVSYAFELTNVGDAPLRIEDVQVKMLEGC